MAPAEGQTLPELELHLQGAAEGALAAVQDVLGAARQQWGQTAADLKAAARQALGLLPHAGEQRGPLGDALRGAIATADGATDDVPAAPAEAAIQATAPIISLEGVMRQVTDAVNDEAMQRFASLEASRASCGTCCH